MIVPLTQENIFPGGVHHRLIVPNRVLELRRDSVILDKEFEGSREVFFFVSDTKRKGSDGRNALLQLDQVSLRPCDLSQGLILNMPGPPSLGSRKRLQKLARY
jgi:hypothetical protein